MSMTPPRAPDNKLLPLLRGVRQGDLISMGAVTLVGWGQAASLQAAQGEAEPGEIWAVTVESEAGWYIILSQDCDIVRDPDIEPCLVISPLSFVPQERWEQLRHGPYSPRQFPFPADKLPDRAEGQFPVADVRYVASMDKTALLNADMETVAPLTGAQRVRFARWVARRYGRPANDDMVEQQVLARAASRIRKLASSFSKAQAPTDTMRLVGASDEWYLSGTDRYIGLEAVMTEAGARSAGLWDDAANTWQHDRIFKAARQLTNDLAKRLPPGGGFVIKINPTTLDKVPASTYVAAWSPWTLERDDPLGVE